MAKKRLEWTGKYRDQHAGKYRVFWSAGAWTLSYDGKRISRHDKRDSAKCKAATGAKPAANVMQPKHHRATKPVRDKQARADIAKWTAQRRADRAGVCFPQGDPNETAMYDSAITAHNAKVIAERAKGALVADPLLQEIAKSPPRSWPPNTGTPNDRFDTGGNS
jgi:hypothetical protein